MTTSITSKAIRPGETLVVGVEPPRSRVRWVLLGLAVLTYGVALSTANPENMGEFGMITILPVAVLAAVVAVLAGFAIAVTRGDGEPVLASYVLAATVMVHGLPAFLYDHLRFSWAWKHVGIVEYIQRTGGVDPHVSVHPVYHNWPGFFGLNAVITETSGLETALSYASWAPILFDLLFVGAAYVLFRAVTDDRRLTWTALLFFMLGNWVGQDYFAPQALAYFFYLMVVAIVVRWYGTEAAGTRFVDTDRLIPGSAPAMAVGGVLGMLLLAIAVSHQITPIATALVLLGLRATKVIRVNWPFVAIVLFTGAWLVGPARDFVLANVQAAIAELGGVEANLDNNLVAPELFNPAQLQIAWTARILSAAVAGLALLGWLRRARRGLSTRWALVLAAAPVALVVMSSYGGEVLFRAYLFALPFAAFLGAALWFPTSSVTLRPMATWLLGATLVVMFGTLLIADFGADNRQVFSDTEVAASEFLFQNAQPGALIVEGSRDYPRQHRNYEQFQYLALDRSRPDTLQNLLEDPAERIAGWVSDTDRYNGGFVIITQSQRASVTALGTLLSPTLDQIETSLRTSDKWEIVFEADDAVVFAPRGRS